jgi:hypothetical protein
MSDDGSRNGTPPKRRALRADRLAAALRQNLRRRKDASRADTRNDTDSNAAEPGGNPPKSDDSR